MIEWSKQALQDREKIFDYISQENAQAAVNIDIRIREQVAQLRIFPQSGRKGRFPATRELMVSETHFIIVYKIFEKYTRKINKIKILRVLHSARHWPA